MDVVQKIPFSFCEKKKLVPVQKSLRHLAVAISDPKDISTLKLNLSQITGGLSINFFLAQEEDITEAILRSYKDERDKKLKRIVQKFEENQDDKDVESRSSELIYDLAEKQLDPLVEFTNNIILEAIGMGASDIHAEIYEKRNRIRFRKDGVLIEKSQISDQMMLSFCKPYQNYGSNEHCRKKKTTRWPH